MIALCTQRSRSKRDFVMDTVQLSRQTSSSLAENHEEELVLLKEKVEHFKHVIHKLQEELQTHKVRKEGAETVSRLLQESKQECLTLKKKIRTYESVIRNLQIRLENHGISNDIALQEGEQYLPGQSKQILENLTRENARLRNLIRNETGDPEELARLQKQCQDLQKEIDECKTVASNYQTQVTELEGLLKASDNVKDVTIATLQADLAKCQRELNTRSSLCTTLAEETQNLQRQLKDVAEQCQELARKLKDKGAPSFIMENRTVVKNHDNKALTEETEGLKKKLKEVTEMNMRWQAYDKQRDAHVATLTQELNDLKARAGPSSMAQDVEFEMNRVLDEARKANTERDKAKRELENAKRTIKTLMGEVQQLRQRASTGSRGDSAETIEALKAQIQICTEDFESERKDREKAQTRLVKAEHEIESLRRENDALKRAQIQRTPVSANEYADQFFHYHGYQGAFGNEGLAARGTSKKGNIVQQPRTIDKYNVIDGAEVQSDGENKRRDEDDVIASKSATDSTIKDDSSDKHSEGKYESLRTSSLSSSCKGSHTSSPRGSRAGTPSDGLAQPEQIDEEHQKDSEILKCPKCGNEFNSDQHFDLLEHVEMCCE